MTPTVADRSALGPGSPPQLTTYESVEQALYARALVK